MEQNIFVNLKNFISMALIKFYSNYVVHLPHNFALFSSQTQLLTYHNLYLIACTLIPRTANILEVGNYHETRTNSETLEFGLTAIKPN